MVLSSKVRDKEIIVLDSLKIEAKTKKIIDLLGKLLKNDKKYSILVITSKKDEKVLKAIRNVGYAKPLAADSLNVLDLLSFKYLLIDKETIKVIEKTYSVKEKAQDAGAK